MSRNKDIQSEPLLTRAEVAALFGVDAQTVTRWARKGRLTAVRTPGGHRRFSEREVRELLEGVPRQSAEPRMPEQSGEEQGEGDRSIDVTGSDPGAGDDPSTEGQQSRGICLVCGESELLDLDAGNATEQMTAFAERHSRHDRFHIDVGVRVAPH